MREGNEMGRTEDKRGDARAGGEARGGRTGTREGRLPFCPPTGEGPSSKDAAMRTYRHVADTRVAWDDEIEVTIIETDEGLAFDFHEEGLRERGSIDGVEVPFSVLADMARQYLRGENWIFDRPGKGIGKSWIPKRTSDSTMVEGLGL